MKAQTLPQCGSKPNCVCSNQDPKDTDHLIKPYEIKSDGTQEMSFILQILSSLDGTTIKESSPDYIRSEFKSRWLGFVDDVEFLRTESAIQIRSASRTGHSDLGVNRKRLENIREQLKQKVGK
jgi:uncharacterized protein (DUF1499 family)